LYGNNRYDTNSAVLSEFKNDLNTSNIYLASGENFPDALACSAGVANTSSPLVLINNNIETSTKSYISNNFNSIDNITLIGGTGVLTDELAQEVSTNFSDINNKASTLTVNQAINILKSLKYRGSFKYEYQYSPNDNYVNLLNFPNSKQILNDYYIFSIIEGGTSWDCNFCVNKNTGEVYVADPDCRFITLKEYEDMIIKLLSSQ